MALIIDEHSILNNLPIELNQYQLLIFDSIRTTLLMIQDDFNSLEYILENYNNSKNNQLETVKAFAFVWGIIDKTHRLVKIYKKIPSESNYKVLDKIKIVDKFRNTFQHLDERIDESLIKNKLPFYGTISWFEFINNKIEPKMIVSGITYGVNVEFKYPEIKNYNSKVNDIILHAVDKKVYINLNINELINDVIVFKNINENHLRNVFKNNDWKPYDWSSKKDIFVTIKTENS